MQHQEETKKDSSAASSSNLLMLSLSRFYSKCDRIKQILPIINGESEISLRLIDWFITNYSKKYNTVLVRNIEGHTVHLNVFLSYRSQLKSYSKTFFDPFRRRDRIRFYYDSSSDAWIDTTIGQLNMFRWMLQYDILDFLRDHKESIESDMINAQRENQKKKLIKDNIKVKVIETENGIVTTTRKRRIELSKSTMKNMNKMEGNRVLQFD